MILDRIFIKSFRNIEQATFTTNSRFNVFHGSNGQGKTNLLEAIFLLGTMKSFRMVKNSELIRWDDPFALIRGGASRDGVHREIALVVDREGKKARVDQKQVVRITDFFGTINTVVFSPEEIGMVRGGPELRRRYLDRAIFSSNVQYLGYHHDYFRILKNRNALLKRGERNSLEVWSSQLAEAGARLVAERFDYLDRIGPLFREFYREIAGGNEDAEVTYLPHRLGREEFQREGSALLEKILARNCEEEYRRGITLTGPHRDDLEFSLNGRVLRNHGSQGQQRSFILALKMAEIEYLHRLFGSPPILLLDDISSELDRQRNENLLRFLQSKTMQVFITTTDIRNLRLQGNEQYTAFHISDGKIINEATDDRSEEQ